jgi:NodT family efflux transporter outer membrane factor (OMF) lipoprotein
MTALAALGAPLLVAACAVGPRYLPPTPAAGAQAPFTSVKPGVEAASEAPDDWWRLYEDPRLDRYVGEAFAANDDLKAAQANLSAARALLDASRAGLYPSTTLISNSTYGRDPGTDEILQITGHKPLTIWAFEDVLDVSYELDLFGRVKSSIAAARADADAAAAARDAVRVTVAAETARAYAQVCTSGEQLAVARDSLALAAHQAEITQRRQQAGAGSTFDVVRAEALVAQARSAIAPLEGQRRSALFQLAALLGRAPSNAPQEALSCQTQPMLKAPVPVGDGAALLRRRPDVRLADRRVAGAVARIGVATADLYPRIILSGFYGGVSSDLNRLDTAQGLAWGVGPRISWGFPNQLAARARIRQARAGDAAALAEFDGVVLQALKETEQAMTIYGAELDRRVSLLEVQDKAARAYRIAQDEAVAGSISTLDLLTAEQAVINANAAVAASDAASAQDQIGLFKALGGGWRSAGPMN